MINHMTKPYYLVLSDKMLQYYGSLYLDTYFVDAACWYKKYLITPKYTWKNPVFCNLI